MSIKDRMEVGQMWKDTGGNTHKIKWVGCTGFVGKTMAGGESFWRFDGAKNWTQTHEADGTPVCEFCGHGKSKEDTCFQAYLYQGTYYSCTREVGHDKTHVACSGKDHRLWSWPQEEEDKSPGVRKVKPEWRTFGPSRDVVDSAQGYKDYIGWEDDAGNLHGFFRITGTVHTVTCISAEQMETGAWERVPIKRLWFEDGAR